jgi:hypothetical protein
MRIGEAFRGSVGVYLRAWHVLRETTRTWETRKVPETSVSGYPPLAEQVSRPKRQVGELMAFRESDQTTQLGDGKAVHTQHLWFCAGVGKGLTEVRSLYRRTQIGQAGPEGKRANLTASDSIKG